MRKVLMALTVLCVFGRMATDTAQAAVPNQLAWQGVALDSNNVPVGDGLYTLHFSIFSDDTGGDSLWGETQVVPVENSVLSVFLGRVVPIPDSVFNGSTRFLQVQFDTQDPYVPRTPIVSVGYAYRTNSVDGALGGQISGELTVDGAVIAEEVTVGTPPASGTEALADGGSVRVYTVEQGGSAVLNDELGEPLIVLTPDPDGEGGQITVTSDVDFTRGITIEGDVDGSGEPRVAIVGTSGAVEFDFSGESGFSLVLPPGSIISDDILDEPGVVSVTQPGAVEDIREEYRLLASVTSVFPADGFALVFSEATFKADDGNGWLDARLIENGSPVGEWQWDPGDPDQWYDQRQTNVSVLPVNAGASTYELRVRHNRGRANAKDAGLTVLYVPTSYGVAPTASSPGPETPAVDVQPTPDPAEVIDPDAERLEAITADQARIEKEMLELETQLAELKEELARTRSLLNVEP